MPTIRANYAYSYYFMWNPWKFLFHNFFSNENVRQPIKNNFKLNSDNVIMYICDCKFVIQADNPFCQQ